MTVRRMIPEDIPRAAELEKMCFSRPWTEEMLAESLALPAYRFFVCEKEGQVLGYAGMFLVLDEGNIANIAVFPEARRQGIGKALLAALTEEGRKEGLSQLFLEVREHNLPAIALYEKSGFTEAGFRKDYYQDPEEGARIYRLDL